MAMTDLINTLECPGEFDALCNLRPGEPYIIFVGRDRLAPPLVHDWADKNRRRALKDFDEGRITKADRDREVRKSTQAEMIAESMVEYKNRWVEDRVEREPGATYTGDELPEETKRRDQLQSLRSRTTFALNNAIAEATELRSFVQAEMPSEEGHDDLALILERAIMKMQRASAETQPRRPLPGGNT